MLSNPEHESTKEENEIAAIIKSGVIVDAGYTDVLPESDPLTEDELKS